MVYYFRSRCAYKEETLQARSDNYPFLTHYFQQRVNLQDDQRQLEAARRGLVLLAELPSSLLGVACYAGEMGRGNTVGDPTAAAAKICGEEIAKLQTQVALLTVNIVALKGETLPYTFMLERLSAPVREAVTRYFGPGKPSQREVGDALCIDESVVRDRLDEAERGAYAVAHGLRWSSHRVQAETTPQKPRTRPGKQLKILV